MVLGRRLTTAFAADALRVFSRLGKDLAATVVTDERGLQTRDSPPLLVANETEVPVWCRVSGSFDEWRLIAPFARLAVRKAGTTNEDCLIALPEQVDLLFRLGSGEQREVLVEGLASNAAHSVKLAVASVNAAWVVGFDDLAGRVLARLRSRVRFFNRTDHAVELSDDAAVFIVPARSDLSLPLSLARQGAQLKIRRARSFGEEWGWSNARLSVWSSEHEEEDDQEEKVGGVVGGSQTGKKQSTGRRSVFASRGLKGVWYAVAGVRAGDRVEQRVVLTAPLVVKNLLPCGAQLSFSTGEREARLLVQPGEVQTCCELDCSQGVWISVRVAAFTGRCAVKVEPERLPRRIEPRGQLSIRQHMSLGEPGRHELLLRSAQGETLKVELRAEKRHRANTAPRLNSII